MKYQCIVDRKNDWPTIEEARVRVRDHRDSYEKLIRCIAIEYNIMDTSSKFSKRLFILTISEYIIKYHVFILCVNPKLIKFITIKLKDFPDFSVYRHEFIKLTDFKKHKAKILYIESLLRDTILYNDVIYHISTFL